MNTSDSRFTPDMEVLGISGSPRQGGNSDLLLETILSGVKEGGLPSSSCNLSTLQFSGCLGCEGCRKDNACTGQTDDMNSLYSRIISSRALVLVSPAHNYNITSWMKAFIDRLYCFYIFSGKRPGPWSSVLSGQGRKAVIAAICEQKSEEDMGFTMDAMKLPLQALGYEITGELPVLNTFYKSRIREQEDLLERARHLGINLAASLLEI